MNNTPPIYCDAVIDEHVGNPLIECLPAIDRTDEEIALAMMLKPAFSATEKALPARVRFALLSRMKKLFVPFAAHHQLFTHIDLGIRNSYSWRNPLNPATQGFLHHPYAVHNAPSLRYCQRSSGSIILLSGLSGIGKSCAMDAIMRALGRPIVDHYYGESRFCERQITYLTLRIPEDRSLKTAVAELLLKIDLSNNGETNYYTQYASVSHCTLTGMLTGLVAALSAHHTACIFVDEIQRLVEGRSTGARDIIEFLFRMRDDCGLTVVLCGTYASLKLLNRQFRINRRLCEDGLVELSRPLTPGDVQWNTLVKVAFDYQWTRETAEASDALICVCHELTLGIPGVLIPLLILSQREAISDGSEILTERVIRRTFAAYFGGLAPLLAALKGGKTWAKNKWDDMFLDFRDMEDPHAVPPAPSATAVAEDGAWGKSVPKSTAVPATEGTNGADTLEALTKAGLVRSPL